MHQHIIASTQFFFLVYLQAYAFAEIFYREPLASTTWDDVWYHIFHKDRSQLKFQTIKIEFCVCCRALTTLRFHWFNTALSDKFHTMKLLTRLVGPQDCTHLSSIKLTIKVRSLTALPTMAKSMPTIDWYTSNMSGKRTPQDPWDKKATTLLVRGNKEIKLMASDKIDWFAILQMLQKYWQKMKGMKTCLWESLTFCYIGTIFQRASGVMRKIGEADGEI